LTDAPAGLVNTFGVLGNPARVATVMPFVRPTLSMNEPTATQTN
jgi:hypothetical protein